MTPILEFIRERLDDSFSGRVIWDSIKDHHQGNKLGAFTFMCTPCQTWSYPCDRLREIASYWEDDESFDTSWKLR